MQQLENVVTEKIAEVLSARSEIGELRRKCDKFDEENEKWKKKQTLLQKMCMDLNTVMKRYIVDEQNKQKDRVSPIKITRSVGLQVSKPFENLKNRDSGFCCDAGFGLQIPYSLKMDANICLFNAF